MGATLAVTQAGRLLTATTPLGGDVLVPVRLFGTEELSRPFLFTVDFSSDQANIAASALLGKPIGIAVTLPDDSTRHFHGLVRRFANLGVEGATGRTGYRAELVPWLWMLSLASDARTFENQSVLDIADAIFAAAGYSDHKRKVTAAPAALPYVVQYGETNLAFISRLLEAAGLHYTFEFAADKHTLVISDAKGSAIPAGALASVPMAAALRTGASRAGAQADAVLTAEREFTVHTQSVALGDFHLLRSADSNSATSQGAGAAGELYEFLGDLSGTPSAGITAAEAKRRIEAEEATGDVVRGTSTCGAFTAGTRVTITGGAFGASGVELQLTRVAHAIENGDTIAGADTDGSLENTFTAIPAATLFRPPRTTPWPSVRGTQTALVIGTGGTGQIDVDANGCVLLQFPWDRGAGKDGGSTHRVHLTSQWSGTGWGAIQLPRVGQRVLVEFLEGDPDRPIVTGRVYSNNHAHPYALPDNKTQSGMKSRSVGGGADNFNELRFEDKSGEEHVYLQAEKDLQTKVKHDETHDVLHDRTTTVTHDDTRTVKEGNDTLIVSKGKQTIEVSEGDQEVTVKTGKQTITVHGDQTLTVQTGNAKIDVTAGNVTIKATAGAVTIEAPAQGITLKSGPSSIEIKPQGVTIKGVQVSVEGQAQAALKGAMVSITGQAMAKLESPMSQITGSALLKLGGGVTMAG